MHKLTKALSQYDLSKDASGVARFFSFDEETKVIKKMVVTKNLILFSGADILAQALAGTPGYKVSTLYLEFKNLAMPGDPVPIPSFDRTGGVAYYNGLASSLDIDYLRIPLQISPSFGTSDETDYENNRVTFVGISEGTLGFHGKLFGSGANSAVYGAALVASPAPDDQTQDRVFSRVYAGVVAGWASAIEKQAGTQIGVTWTVRFN